VAVDQKPRFQPSAQESAVKLHLKNGKLFASVGLSGAEMNHIAFRPELRPTNLTKGVHTAFLEPV